MDYYWTLSKRGGVVCCLLLLLGGCGGRERLADNPLDTPDRNSFLQEEGVYRSKAVSAPSETGQGEYDWDDLGTLEPLDEVAEEDQPQVFSYSPSSVDTSAFDSTIGVGEPHESTPSSFSSAPGVAKPVPEEFPLLPETVEDPNLQTGPNGSRPEDGIVEWGDVRIDLNSQNPTQVAPYLTDIVADEFAESVFEDIENRDSVSFMEKVVAPDAATIWEKATRVPGKWRVRTTVQDPQTIRVDAEFKADKAAGLFKKSYTWRVTWDNGWRVLDWQR